MCVYLYTYTINCDESLPSTKYNISKNSQNNYLHYCSKVVYIFIYTLLFKTPYAHQSWINLIKTQKKNKSLHRLLQYKVSNHF